MLHGILNAEWITLHGLVALLGVAVFVIASRARGQRRHPSAAMAWVVALALMPYVSLPLYFLIGNRKVGRQRPPSAGVTSPLLPAPDTPVARFQQFAAALGVPGATSYQDLHLHEDGVAALQALRSLLLGATHTLDVCTFLLGRDALGNEVTDILAQRARDGVRVRLMIDGIGRYLGGRPRLERLTAAGVEVAVFVSPFRSALPGRTNLRNHRKLVVADGQRTWTGGRNLASEYFNGDPGGRHPVPAWIDLSFDFAGDLARQTQQQFNADWAFATHNTVPAATQGDVAADFAGTQGAQLIPSGPDQADDTLYALLISSCFTARTRIMAVTPYFVPDAMLMLALTLAARRGIAVDLILPAQSNHRLADVARYSALRDISDAGGRVWLVPGMVHAKAILIDELALAGSANLDERSLFLNYELMIAFYAPADVAHFSQWVSALRSTGRRYQANPPGLARQFVEGIVRWLAFQL